jgi:hypothetical protein
MQNTEILTDVDVATGDVIRKQRAIIAWIRRDRDDRNTNHNREVSKQLRKARAVRGSLVGESKSDQKTTRTRGGA